MGIDCSLPATAYGLIKRLKQSGLYDFFEDIFDSQSIEFQKPSKQFFDYVMSHITDFNKKEALIIGDSLNTDIKGGQVETLTESHSTFNRKGESSGYRS
ncbi:hypothetical protein EBB07_27270 [Paenibacillaceae bacterium]|nr:hypothetical protein EBB07_27270 [Paenibacillaceae bacterium]